MRWNFAQRLSLLLLRKQMSRQQLADGVGLSRVAADKWANGESLPRANVIPRIAEFLGVPAESLDPKAESLSDPFCEFQLNGAKYLLLKSEGVLEAAEKGDLEKVVGILSNRRTPRQAEMPNEHNPLVFSVTDVYPPEKVNDIKVVGRVLRKMACEEVR